MRLLFERLAFTALIVGIILAGYAAYRVVTINNKLDKNIAEQVRRSGGLTESQVTTSAGFGLMSADLERRELRQDRNAAYVFGGVGLALIGVGWLGYDVLSSRKRRAAAQAQTPASSEALET